MTKRIFPARNRGCAGSTGMDFIEKIFGFAPDNGSGVFELLLFAIPVFTVLAIRAWRNRGGRK
jgi:hypothetical protein